MLETFKARLKAKTMAAGVNLSTKRMDALADRLHKKFPDLTEDAEHDEMLDELDELISFADVAKEDDRVRTLEAKANLKPPEPKPADPKPNDPPKDDEHTTLTKALMEQMKTLSEKIQEIEKGKVYETVKHKLAQQLKDVPSSIWSKRVLPENEEAIENFVTEVQNDYKTDFVEKGLLHTNSGSGRASYSTNGKATVEETKGIVDKILPKQ